MEISNRYAETSHKDRSFQWIVRYDEFRLVTCLFRKVQISISQTTDFHFVSFHFVSQSTISKGHGKQQIRRDITQARSFQWIVRYDEFRLVTCLIRKVQISISQTTYFHFVSFHFVSQSTISHFEFIEAMYGNIENPRIIVLDCDRYSHLTSK